MMDDVKIEVKKDFFRQQQEGITKIGFTFQHKDIPDYLSSAMLGKRFYMWLIDADDYDSQNPTVKESLTVEAVTNRDQLTEGEKLRTRAVLLCKQDDFQEFCYFVGIKDEQDFVARADGRTESDAREFILWFCQMASRSELATNLDALSRFKEMLAAFDSWKMEQTYKDNLERV